VIFRLNSNHINILISRE